MTSRHLTRFLVVETNPHGPGWAVLIKPLRRPAGNRAIDFPWYSHNANDPWWRGRRWVAFIPAFDLRVGTNQRGLFDRRRRRFTVEVRGLFGRGCTPRFVPAWWS